nr:hypothetical protein [uncultured archaeon]
MLVVKNLGKEEMIKCPNEDQGIVKKIFLAARIVVGVKNFWVYFIDYFRLSNEPFVQYNLRNGLRLKTRNKTSDRNLINEIFIKKDYTKKFDVGEKDVVVDIGANIGMFSLLAAKSAVKGRVYSFEPFSENFNLLMENIKLNNLENIVPIKGAVAQRNGTRKLYLVKGKNFGGNSFEKKHWQADTSKTIKVETVTLDKFIRSYKIEKIDFLKVDCEGAEYEILMNCSKDTLSKIRKISLEFHDFDKTKKVLALIKFLEDNNFDVVSTEIGRPIGMIYAVNKD